MTEEKEEKKEILLNIMYNGKYLQSANQNIGHEIINLFQADNGNNYIYVLPYGCMAQKHNGKIKTILLVTRHNASLLEVLAKAENLEQIIKIKGSWKNQKDNIHKEQKQYIENNNITYGGVRLNDIMEENESNETAFYITFKAERIVKPKKRIFITTANENTEEKGYWCILEDVKFARQSPKMYFSNKSNAGAYKKLDDLIQKKELWENEKYSQKVSTNVKLSTENNFIDIIKKGYDELCYSNLFQYIFSAKKNMFSKFAKDVLEIENFSDDYIVERETYNIDLLIRNGQQVIVIENKIKSGINGICKNTKEDDKIKSQLDDYYKYVEDEKNFSKQYDKHYFVFAPNYNIIDLKKYDNSGKYKLIKYSKIYDFFDNNKNEYEDIPYFQEFLYALKKHTKDVDNHNDIEAENRFLKAILKAK